LVLALKVDWLDSLAFLEMIDFERLDIEAQASVAAAKSSFADCASL
jgi:hypothetical protein